MLFAGTASAQSLSRADAVAQALAANPTMKLSFEQVALLEGRIVEAKADALPDVTWNTFAGRSRDGSPGQPDSTRFHRVSRGPGADSVCVSTSAHRQTVFSFKLGKALEAARSRVAGDQEHSVRGK
jgi:outer membrane protein TolC